MPTRLQQEGARRAGCYCVLFVTVCASETHVCGEGRVSMLCQQAVSKPKKHVQASQGCSAVSPVEVQKQRWHKVCPLGHLLSRQM